MTNYSERKKYGGYDSNRSGGRDFGRSTEMHNTTCADCGKNCEVPFKPNGKKPVYCLNCFGKNGGQVSPNHFLKKSSSEFDHSAPKVQNDSKKFDELSYQLKAVNDKLDKLVSLAEMLSAKL